MVPDHPFYPGQIVVYNGPSTPDGQLADGAQYVVIVLDDGTIQLASPDAPTVPLPVDVSNLGPFIHELVPGGQAVVIAGADVVLEVGVQVRDDDVTSPAVVLDTIHAGGDVDVVFTPAVLCELTDLEAQGILVETPTLIVGVGENRVREHFWHFPIDDDEGPRPQPPRVRQLRYRVPGGGRDDLRSCRRGVRRHRRAHGYDRPGRPGREHRRPTST